MIWGGFVLYIASLIGAPVLLGRAVRAMVPSVAFAMPSDAHALLAGALLLGGGARLVPMAIAAVRHDGAVASTVRMLRAYLGMVQAVPGLVLLSAVLPVLAGAMFRRVLITPLFSFQTPVLTVVDDFLAGFALTHAFATVALLQRPGHAWRVYVEELLGIDNANDNDRARLFNVAREIDVMFFFSI